MLSLVARVKDAEAEIGNKVHDQKSEIALLGWQERERRTSVRVSMIVLREAFIV